MEQIYEQIIKGIVKHFKDSKLHKAVIGVSGGVDSSLTLKLTVDALGAQKVIAVSMPELTVTNPENTNHAKVLCEALNVTYHQIPINSFLVGFAQLPWKQSVTAAANNKARIRAVILYNCANSMDGMVIGTSNKSELMLGYGTKYGDLACDIMPLGDLYKHQVIDLANHVGLPPEITQKTPTAELYEGQTDAEELGATYGEIDPILKRAKQGSDNLISKGMKPTLVHNIMNRIEKNKHKGQMPPIIKVKISTK